jgi:hypothetical protein
VRWRPLGRAPAAPQVRLEVRGREWRHLPGLLGVGVLQAGRG